MSNGFAGIREEGGSGDFTKVVEGKPVVVHLLGEPEKSLDHWHTTDKKTVTCSGPGCQTCSDPQWKKAAKTWKVKVFNLTTMKEEILQKGWSVIGPITETWEAFGKDLSGTDFRISVKGSGLTTEYTVINTPTKFKPEMIASHVKEEEHNPFV